MLLVALMICISLRMSCIMNLHIYPPFSFSCGCFIGSHYHPDYWRFGCWSFPQLQTNRLFHPFHAQTTQVSTTSFQFSFFQLKLWWSSRYRFQTKVQVFMFCFCSASAAWWNPLTLGMGWRFGRVTTWISDPHTLECHSLTQACRWWVLDKCIQAANHFQDH